MESGPRKIVVIEDEPQIRELIERILRSAGYAVAGTGEPAEAVGLVRAEDPDLVLCDIAMPGLDGYAVLKALQSDPATARHPVVFLTAHKEFSERVQAFRFGVVDYMTKPFTRELLLKKVERILQNIERRPGLLGAGGEGGAASLLEEVQREARSGVLSVKGEAGEAKVVLRAGEVVEKTAPVAAEEASQAEFQELDPNREAIVAHDPPALSGDVAGTPSFDALPAVLRSALVVDDNRVFRKFLTDLLRERGFAVEEASSGAEALALALEHRPWLILTDVKMPGMDGIEFCRSVRAHSLIRHTPLVFLSGWDDYKERYRGLEAGADEYLSKQTPVRELLIRIHLILKRYADVGAARGRGRGMEGSIEVIGAPGFLQMCHLSRLSGVCTVRSGTRIFEARFRDGDIVGARLEARGGEEAVFEFLGWTRGYFEFSPGDPGPGEPLGETFNQILLEGCRRLDEAQRSGPEQG